MAKVIMTGANKARSYGSVEGGWADQQNVSQLAFQTVKDKEFFLVYKSGQSEFFDLSLKCQIETRSVWYGK